MTDAASVRDAFAQVVAAFGGVDIAISNAGAAWQGRIGEVDEAILRQSFELNFFAHQKVAQAAVKIMLAQGTGGCLLFNVSKQAVNPGANFGPYGLPKAATLFLVRQYALDYGADGIRANAVNADRIRSGLLTDDFIKQRAKARGLSEKDYMTRQSARPRGHRRGRGAGLSGPGAGAQDHRRRHHRRRREYCGGAAIKCYRDSESRPVKGAMTMLRTIAVIGLLPLLLAGEPGLRRSHQGAEDGDLQIRRRRPEARRRQAQRLHQEVHGPRQFRAAGTQSRQEAGAKETEEAGRHGRAAAAGAAPAAETIDQRRAIAA